MHSRPPLAMLALTALALALPDEEKERLTPEQKKVREARIRQAEAEEAQRRAAHNLEYKLQQDAIAAPYREARRLRNLKKIEQQAKRKP